MSNLSMVEARLPPGFRFHPKDQELICDYLMKKVMCCDLQPPLLVEVDLNKSEPWDIPESAMVGRREWYFYSQRDRKYATGLRTNRATVSGYWKATGKDRPVLRKGTLVGMRKTLVFYQGRAPKGKKTDWVMHEFRLEGSLVPPKLSSSKADWVLCRVFYKNREGPTKQAMAMGLTNNLYDHDTHSSSSSLPPLMEPYSLNNLTFEQHTQVTCNQVLNDEHYEQVPCFSIFTPYQTDQTLSHIISTSCQTHMDSNPYAKITSNSPTFGTIPFPSSSSHDVSTYLDSSFSCEKKVVFRDVSNQFLNKEIYDSIDMKLVNPSSSFGDQGSTSDQSFLSDVCLPNANTAWYHY